MYISQVFSAKSKRVYAIVCAIVLLLLFQGAFQENNNETEKVMKEMISQIGELPTFALTLVSFAFFLFPLFFIVKVFHNQAITQFTTSRKKNRFQTNFFQFFSLWRNYCRDFLFRIFYESFCVCMEFPTLEVLYVVHYGSALVACSNRF